MTLSTNRGATTIIESHYNAYLNKVFLDYLGLGDLGLKMDSHSFFGRCPKDKYTLFENELLSVRESTLRNVNTSKLNKILFVISLFHRQI
jgi:hypothetical protein